MKKANFIRVFIAVVMAVMMSCGGGSNNQTDKKPNDTSVNKLNSSAKLDIDVERQSFRFVDSKSGRELSYNKLIVDGNAVIDTYVMAMMTKSVAFAFKEGEIVREGGSVTLNCKIAYTEHSELNYTLENGVLTILGLVE